MLSVRCLRAVAETHVADDVLDHDDGAIDHHAEIEGAEREQVGGNSLQVETNRRE